MQLNAVFFVVKPDSGITTRYNLNAEKRNVRGNKHVINRLKILNNV